MDITRKQNTQNIAKNEHFLAPDTRTCFEIRPFALLSMNCSIEIFRKFLFRFLVA